MTEIDLIIFDCDGMLVDSERLANDVFAAVLAQECGLHFSREEMFDTFVGRSSAQCMAIVTSLIGGDPPAGLEARYKNDINRALAESVLPVRGIREALDKLTIPHCVASSGSHEKMHITLGRTDLLARFEGRCFSTAEVARGKPHPDIYRHAMTQMGVDSPARCLVIEDSAPGVAGGVAAGMSVFGYCELTKRETLQAAGAHHTFDDMSRLVEEIASYRRVAVV